jgi:streptogramin lyase
MVANAMPTMTVVLGDRRYAVERFWASPPEAIATGLPSQVAVDRAGRIHFLQRAKPAVVVFDPDGSFAFAYGDQVDDPHGIYRDAADRVFVADRDAHQIIAFSAKGEELFRLGERHAPRWRRPFNHPTDVAVAADGRIFVADGYGNARVHRFGPDGRFELSWGALGREPGQFMTPHAVWVDAPGAVLVADRENGRIQRFTADGALIDIWTGLQNPMDIWVDDRGQVHVTDQVPSLVLFSAGGELLGRCRPSLNGAHGIFGDAAGNLYLAEMNPPSLTRLRLLA